ncbi:MAG: MBL fold metallo-hydrolase [Clostridia bacterium]|nr:MBL fold metallo-hydrolase [Clostridia bacterium]
MKKHVRILSLLLCLLVTFLLVGCDPGGSSSVPSSQASAVSQQTVSQQTPEQLTAHFIDVGQGDAIFVELPDERTMLIDSGESEYGSKVIDYITDLGYSRLDYLVITHAHTDHMGSMKQVVTHFEIGQIFMPRTNASSKTYRSMLQAISDKGLKITQAKAGVSVLQEEELQAHFLSPNRDTYAEHNNYSAALKLTYGEIRYLFMADAEQLSEQEITDDVSADIVKVGHHGSDSSSGEQFVQRVGAKIAVISVGEGNRYRHPSDKIIARWRNSGATVYRTDRDGTVSVSTDGAVISLKTQNGQSSSFAIPQQSAASSQAQTTYVLNTANKKIHAPDCYAVSQIAAQNKQETTQTPEALQQQGYTVCGICKAQ